MIISISRLQGRAELAMKVVQGMSKSKGKGVNEGGGHQGMRRVSGSGRAFGLSNVVFLLVVINKLSS